MRSCVDLQFHYAVHAPAEVPAYAIAVWSSFIAYVVYIQSPCDFEPFCTFSWNLHQHAHSHTRISPPPPPPPPLIVFWNFQNSKCGLYPVKYSANCNAVWRFPPAMGVVHWVNTLEVLVSQQVAEKQMGICKCVAVCLYLH